MALKIVDTDSGNEHVIEGIFATRKMFIDGVDRARLGVRQAGLLIDRGLTHVFGSEAASKFNARKDKGEATDADRAGIVEAAQIEYRDKLYSDSWATGTRVSSATPMDRKAQIAQNEAVKEMMRLFKDHGIVKAPKANKTDEDSWVHPSDTTKAYTRDVWLNAYLNNDEPDPKGEYATLGEARRALHDAEAERLFAEEQRKLAQRMEDRKVIGTSLKI